MPAHTYSNIWTGAPTSNSGGDMASVILGVRMQTAAAGRVMGARYFRDLSDGAAHLAILYDAASLDPLETTVFHRPAAAGAGAGTWQSAYFRRARKYAAGERFVIGVFFDGGDYWLNPGALASGPVVNGNLRATQDGDGGANGLFAYSGLEPTSTFNSNHYAVDVIFLEDGN